jgi:hypothetical protein
MLRKLANRFEVWAVWHLPARLSVPYLNWAAERTARKIDKKLEQALKAKG